MTIKVGESARNFEIKAQNDEIVSLESLRGKKVLLSFHPLSWTSVCAEQMKLLEKYFKEFESLNVVPLGISVDPVPSKRAWSESLGLKNLKILSDFWPHGEVSKSFGLFIDKFGFSERANVLLDENGIVIFVKVYPIKQIPDFEEIIAFIKSKTY